MSLCKFGITLCLHFLKHKISVPQTRNWRALALMFLQEPYDCYLMLMHFYITWVLVRSLERKTMVTSWNTMCECCLWGDTPIQELYYRYQHSPPHCRHPAGSSCSSLGPSCCPHSSSGWHLTWEPVSSGLFSVEMKSSCFPSSER